jgi:flagellar protein FliJ
MRAFRFRLASVLKLREATRDQRLAQLAEAHAASDKLRARRSAIEAELAQLNRLQHGRMATGKVNIDVLLSSSRYDAIMRAEIATIAGHEATLAVEIERRQQAVMAADREVRMLEKLRDKQREQHRQSEALAELKELDEIAARQSWQQTHGFAEMRSFEETHP